MESSEPLNPDALIVKALLSTQDNIVETAEGRARSLLFSWIVSLKPGADVATAAVDLQCQLLTASPECNPLLPHLCALLEEVRAYASRPCGRRRLMRADA